MFRIRSFVKAVAGLALFTWVTLSATAAMAERPEPAYQNPPLNPNTGGPDPGSGFFDSGLWRGLLIAAAILAAIGISALVVGVKQRHGRASERLAHS